jgi:hypothetical protein
MTPKDPEPGEQDPGPETAKQNPNRTPTALARHHDRHPTHRPTGFIRGK